MKHKKAKFITTIICMVLSLIALYAFCFVVDVKLGWRIALIIISLSWIGSGIPIIMMWVIIFWVLFRNRKAAYQLS